MTSRTAVVLGASGLVGGFCLRALVDDPDYTRVLTFGRRELPSLTRAKVAQRVSDLATLSAEDFQGAQDVFCALGTTIRKAGSQEALQDEIGDLLFVIVNIARFLKVDPEQALRGTNSKFRRRFEHVEKGLEAQKKPLSEATIEEMEALWQDSKRHGL